MIPFIKLKLSVLCVFIVLCSCSTTRRYDIDYKGENNYQSIYIVDSIIIKDPVRVHSKRFGGQFITSKSTLIYYKGKKDFFERPDVFLLGTDLYRDLPIQQFKKYNYPDYGNCNLTQSSYLTKDLEIFEFIKTPKFFILGLINSNYYYVKHDSYGMFSFQNSNTKATYYKILYPICEK